MNIGILWQFDRPYYRPRQKGTLDLWLSNREQMHLYIPRAFAQFPWGWRNSPSRSQIPPLTVEPSYIGKLQFTTPASPRILQPFRPGFELLVYNHDSAKWEQQRSQWMVREHYVKLLPAVQYVAFVSRSNRDDDRPVVEPIVDMIREWGFETVTVGIDVFANPDDVAPKVKDQIKAADCLFAIATPRDLSFLTGVWKTLEWLHGEVGIAYGHDHPILVIRSEDTDLGGLPAEIRETLEFHPLRPTELKKKLDTVMPSLIDAIRRKRSERFWKMLGKVAAGTASLILAGYVGYEMGVGERS